MEVGAEHGDDEAGRRWWRLRWYEPLPELVLAVSLSAFLVDETDAATSAFASSRALALMGGTALVWVAVRLALLRFTTWSLARTALFTVAAVGILAVVVLPAYDDETVVETLAGTVAGVVPAVPSEESTGAVTPSAAPAGPAVPVRVATGSLRGVDHRASGTVALYRRPDGGFVVGLEDFDIQPGPDYDVYVVPGPDRRDRSGGTRVDDLRGNRGTQFSDAPAGLDLARGTWSVLVWCQTFGVPVATATLV